MARVLSIELGHSVVKLCEMEHNAKKPKIYQCQEAITPNGAVMDGYIVDSRLNDLAYTIKETIARNGIKTKKVIFTVASGKIINREVTIPAVKEAQISSVIQANLSEYFPVSLADYEVTQSLVQTISEGADAGKHRVLVFAAEKSMIDSYRKLANACGLDMLNVYCSGASIIEAARGQRFDGCQAIIKIEEKYSIISIMKDGVLMLQRSINYGVGDAMTEVATQPSFACGDTLAVWRLITRQNCTEESVGGVKEAGRPEGRKAVTEAINPLLSGIMRVFDYFISHFDGMEIEGVSIIGLGAQFIGVPEILSEAMGIVCKKAGMFQDIEAYDSDVKQKSDAYFSCIGAGFAKDGFVHEGSGAGKLAKEPNWVLMSVLVGALCAVVAITMVIMSVLPYNNAKKENEQLQAQYDTYIEGKKIYDAYMNTQTLYQEMREGNLLSMHSNDGLLAFLIELEKKLPEDVEVYGFLSNDEGCAISMNVSDKEKAAKVIDTLRDFDSVMYAQVELMEEVDEQLNVGETATVIDENGEEVEVTADDFEEGSEGAHMIRFTVECVYYPIVLDELSDPTADTTGTTETPADTTAAAQ